MNERFLFDREFDDQGQTRPKARAATYGEDDISAARAQGYAEGEMAGSDSANRTIEANATAALEEMTQQMAQASAEFGQFAEAWRCHAAGIAIAVGRKLAGKLIENQPLAEVEAMILDCVSQLHEEPRLVVRLSPAVADHLRDRVAGIAQAAGFDGHLVLLPEEAMGDQDCRVEWAEGGVERNLNTTEAEIQRAVDAFMANAAA
ncbi:MAG: hypothetical protein ACMVY4_21095 [Minwuia sp.]|uniref:FliH/SctL family protein n=1 Tax=Minwuia sp. TaxID=2493630 RepID=UPI003A89DC98